MTKQPVRPNCPECKELASGIPVFDREPGCEDEDEPPAETQAPETEPPIETRPVPTAAPRAPREPKEPSTNGQEYFRFQDFTECLGRAVATLDRLPRQYGLVQKPTRPTNAAPIIVTPELKEIRGHLDDALSLTERYENKLKTERSLPT